MSPSAEFVQRLPNDIGGASADRIDAGIMSFNRGRNDATLWPTCSIITRFSIRKRNAAA
jgi:hypothetical protein